MKHTRNRCIRTPSALERCRTDELAIKDAMKTLLIGAAIMTLGCLVVSCAMGVLFTDSHFLVSEQSAEETLGSHSRHDSRVQEERRK
jgi:F0F1-type ATP synthase membrane subunit c/vacuolar-type H+-ATPase subunit K